MSSLLSELLGSQNLPKGLAGYDVYHTSVSVEWSVSYKQTPPIAVFPGQPMVQIDKSVETSGSGQ